MNHPLGLLEELDVTDDLGKCAAGTSVEVAFFSLPAMF
jgi:hypothetical protein